MRVWPANTDHIDGRACCDDTRVPHGQTPPGDRHRLPEMGAGRARRYRCWTSRRGMTDWRARNSPSTTTIPRAGSSGQQSESDRSLVVRADDDALAALTAMVAGGITLVLTDVPADLLLRLAAACRDKRYSVQRRGDRRCAAAAGLSQQRDLMSRRRVRRWPTRWRSTWYGRNGRAGCWPTGRTPMTCCWPTRIAARPSASVPVS